MLMNESIALMLFFSATVLVAVSLFLMMLSLLILVRSAKPF